MVPGAGWGKSGGELTAGVGSEEGGQRGQTSIQQVPDAQLLVVVVRARRLLETVCIYFTANLNH